MTKYEKIINEMGEIMRPPRISFLFKLANNQGYYYTDSLITGVIVKVNLLLTETTLSMVTTLSHRTWGAGLKEICIEYEIQSFG